MGKNAVYWTPNFYHYKDNSELKKLSLLFDKIYFKKSLVKSVAPEVIQDDVKNREIVLMLREELKLFDYLIDQKVFVEFDSTPATKSDITSENELQFLNDYLEGLRKRTENQSSLFNVDQEIVRQRLQATFKVHDIQARVDAVALSKKDEEAEYYPILKSDEVSVDIGKKKQVVHFILANIPEPDENTPWEQIIDFRSDEDTRLQYLALINWINEIARSNFTPAEIKDKYEYLYLDYKRSYERHKIKSTFSTLEIVAAAGTAFFTNNVPLALSLSSNFLRIGTSVMNLLKEEGNLPGKEIAYIYHTNQEFNSQS
ncbi:MAG: hypothetical protein JNN00_17715 [Chitinophagaceae bacterium]|nr:hypothetical protein [Chitinophagaceae bacterium]